MIGTPTVTPAYGRDYKSAKAAKADWDANLDFTFHDVSSRWDGMMCSKQDLEGPVKLRYAKLGRVIMVEGGKNVK